MEPPDRLEKGLRFGCGFIFGCVICFGALLTSLILTVNVHSAVAWSIVVGLLCGYAAVRFGDAFWKFVGRLGLPWW